MVTCKTEGISPIHQSDAPDELDVLCKELVLSEQPQEVFFLWQWSNRGDEVSHEITLAANLFPKPRLRQKVDMLGATRALFGKKPGIGLYLGTSA